MDLPLKAQRFIEANRKSPLVYQSASSDVDEVTFRLSNGQVFELTGEQARHIDAFGYELQWAHLVGAPQLVGSDA